MNILKGTVSYDWLASVPQLVGAFLCWWITGSESYCPSLVNWELRKEPAAFLTECGIKRSNYYESKFFGFT